MNSPRRRFALAVLLAALASATIGPGSAIAATGGGQATCNSGSFKTIVESASVRVYTSHGKYYACQRSGGRSYRFAVAPPVSGGVTVTNIQLAGSFVGWYMTDSNGSNLGRLDVKTGARRSYAAGTCCEFIQSDDVEYVMTSRGTIVYLEAVQYCHGGSCFFTNTLKEDSGHGPKTLDDEQNASAPIGQLALSQPGDYVYWLGSDGQPHSTRIT